ncbi:MAG: zf-TFIIB domain-containing protein [Gemmatimonadota bacterium]
MQLDSDLRDVPAKSRRYAGAPRPTNRHRWCSACRVSLTVVVLDGIEIDRCEDCGGIWLDLGEVDAARLRLERSPSTTSRRTPRDADQGGALVDGLTELALWLARGIF